MVKSRIIEVRQWEKSDTREFHVEHYDEKTGEWKTVLQFAQNKEGEFGYGHRVPKGECWYLSERVLRWVWWPKQMRWEYNNDTKTFRNTPLYKGFAKSVIEPKKDPISGLFKPTKNIFSIKNKKNNPDYVWGNTARVLEYQE